MDTLLYTLRRGDEMHKKENRIREYRMKALMSQAELAKKAGIKPALLSKIERGHSYPSMETAIKIARALNTTIDSLFLSKVDTEVYPVSVIA